MTTFKTVLAERIEVGDEIAYEGDSAVVLEREDQGDTIRLVVKHGYRRREVEVGKRDTLHRAES